ncbi:glycosyltransferase family 2 protein [Roseovarius aquimarinus]|uniref:Glycosyltransferase family 2 protein n=1 Tax=Roseovarius aquimarinus TaxID=1229156 RepID=A0ABW7IAE0_9RHOB
MTARFDLSIIVTVYNSEDYLDACLASIERQTVERLEVVIVNDGSTDSSEAIIRSFLRRNPEWRYFSQPNKGVGFTRNRALLLARGDYVGFLDSDDRAEDAMYGDLLHIARRDEACVVLSNFSKWDYTARCEITERKDRFTELSALSDEERLAHIFGGKIFGMACCSIFRRALFLEAGSFFPVSTFHEDIFVMPILYAHAARISASPDKGYVWRMRPQSESHSINSKHVLGVMHALSHLQAHLVSLGQYDALRRNFTTYCIMYLNGLLKRVESLAESVPSKSYLLDLMGSATNQILADKRDFVPLHAGSYGPFVAFAEAARASQKKIVNAALVKPLRSFHCDVAFFPHKTYHTLTMLPIARALQERGLSCAFIDMSEAYADEGAYAAFDRSEFPVVSFAELGASSASYAASVFMNDWDVKCALPTVLADNARGRATFGIVEGIQDFWDVDTGRHRNAYQYVRYLIAAGAHDLRHFTAGLHKDVHIGGVPRIAPLLQRDARFPSEKTALINVNFTYGVLESERAAFIASAVAASRAAGFRPLLTRHPQDLGDLSGHEVAACDMYSAIDGASVLISRFSSAIIESVAMGKPAIYFNPGLERVDKFLEPLGAFEICRSEDALAAALRALARMLDEAPAEAMGKKVRGAAAQFLERHCGVGSEAATSDAIAEFIASKTEVLSWSPPRRDGLPVVSVSPDALPPQEDTAVSSLRAAATALLLDPATGLARIGRDGDLAGPVAKALAQVSDGAPIRVHFEKARAFAEAASRARVTG